MINISFNLAFLFGLLDLILSLAYLITSIVLPIYRRRFIGEIRTILYIFQGILAPIFLLICGVIFIFQGWRLDPILQMAVSLLHLLIIYLWIKDILISNLVYQRDRNS